MGLVDDEIFLGPLKMLESRSFFFWFLKKRQENLLIRRFLDLPCAGWF